MKTQALLFACCLIVARPERAESARAPSNPALLIDDPEALEQLEVSGYAFDAVVSAEQRRALRDAIGADMREFTEGLAVDSVKRAFDVGWLTRGRFELVGVVNRFDRRFDPPEPPSCGEVRLVYRLALQNPGRPATRLPMTVNVRFPQPLGPGCRDAAARWRSGKDMLAILRGLPPFTKLETNFQSLHVPSYRLDMDDNAEYTLRTFEVRGDSLVPGTLLNTPRADLSAAERDELARWVRDNFGAIDAGTATMPERFLATRSVSVSPRGLLNAANRQFSRLFPDPQRTFADFPLTGAARATTVELLMRRLDEATCAGCHQSRGVAGFHLLGEERDPAQTFNALAVGHSPHLAAELPWRAEVLAAAARSAAPMRSRPFSAHQDGPGRENADCGLVPGFASWTCAPGLVCRDLQKGPLGVCAVPEGARPGDPCESVSTQPSTRPEGATIASEAADALCPAITTANMDRAFCAPNWLGFTGGMCSATCTHNGALDGTAICAPLPAAGYEAECFTSREPIERCLRRHFMNAKVATCDAEHACRDDYACTRVPGAAAGVGACVPPYFVFQVRVDGPRLDR